MFDLVFKGSLVSCWACSGTGFLEWKNSGKTLTCSVCKGTGKIIGIRGVKE